MEDGDKCNNSIFFMFNSNCHTINAAHINGHNGKQHVTISCQLVLNPAVSSSDLEAGLARLPSEPDPLS